MNSLVSSFVSESRTRLVAMEERLLGFEWVSPDVAAIATIIRDCAVIRQGASALGVRYIEDFLRPVAELLDQLQLGAIPANGELAGVMLACRDHVDVLLEVLATGMPEPDRQTNVYGSALLAILDTKRFRGGVAGSTLPNQEPEACVSNLLPPS
jgi:two-component system chemotaxis sensor kinase CheA